MLVHRLDARCRSCEQQVEVVDVTDGLVILQCTQPECCDVYPVAAELLASYHAAFAQHINGTGTFEA